MPWLGAIPDALMPPRGRLKVLVHIYACMCAHASLSAILYICSVPAYTPGGTNVQWHMCIMHAYPTRTRPEHYHFVTRCV